MAKYRVAFLISHPIQYVSGFLEEIARQPEIDLTVYYCSDESIKGMLDQGFGKEVKWDIPLLKGYKFVFLKNYSPFATIFKPPLGLINFGIVKEINAQKFDAVIILGWHYLTYWLAYLAAFWAKTPVFVRADPSLNQEMLKPRWKIAVKKIILGQLFRRVKGFLAVGTENKNFFRFYGVEDKRIFFLPHAVDNNRFFRESGELKPKKDEIKKELGLASGKRVVLFCGKLLDKKRPFDLLKAFEQVDFADKALIFLGDGVLKDNLQDYARAQNIQDVIFAGFKNQTEVSRYYAVADVLVLPSTVGETWGLAVNEAMCFGLPVIVSDLTGCSADLVKHGENGFVFKTGNVPELASYLENILKDEQLCVRMGERSAQIIKDWNFSAGTRSLAEALKVSV